MRYYGLELSLSFPSIRYLAPHLLIVLYAESFKMNLKSSLDPPVQ